MSDFYQGMTDYLQSALDMCVKEITILRRENTDLKNQIAVFPVTAWELQEKVTSLELQVTTLRGDMNKDRQ